MKFHYKLEHRSETVRGLILLAITLFSLAFIPRNAVGVTDELANVVAGDSGKDFMPFYAVGQLYNNGHRIDLYDTDVQRQAELQLVPSRRCDPNWIDGKKLLIYSNPPFYLPVTAYLASFSLPVAFVIACIIAAGLLGALLVVSAILVVRAATLGAGLAWIAICLAGGATLDGLSYAQLPSYIIGLSFALGVLFLRDGRAFWAGLVLALVAVKVQYVPPLLLFLLVVKSRDATSYGPSALDNRVGPVRFLWSRPALQGWMLGSSLLVLMALVAVGPAGVANYVTTQLEMIGTAYDRFFRTYPAMYNWRGLLEYASPGVSPLSSLILTALTWLLAIWAWTAVGLGGLSRGWKGDIALLLLALTMLLTSPVTHAHDLILLLPPLGLLIGRLWSKRVPWLLTLLSAGALFGLFWILYYPNPAHAARLPGTALKVNVLSLALMLAISSLLLGIPQISNFLAPLRLRVRRSTEVGEEISPKKSRPLLETRRRWWLGPILAGLMVLTVGGALLAPIKDDRAAARSVDVEAVLNCTDDGRRIEDIALVGYGPQSWWNVVCRSGSSDPGCNVPNLELNASYNLDPAATAAQAGARCFGLAWNTLDGDHVVSVFTREQHLRFGIGGGYAKVCVPMFIQITAADIGAIQVKLLGQAAREYGDKRAWTFRLLDF